MLKLTNQQAAMEGAGGSIYPDFTPFKLDEIEAYMGLLLANGISPKPNMGCCFITPEESKIFGNYHFKNRFKGGEQRWKMFRRFFTLYDSRLHLSMP